MDNSDQRQSVYILVLIDDECEAKSRRCGGFQKESRVEAGR